MRAVDAEERRCGPRFLHPFLGEVAHFLHWLQQALLDDEHRQLGAIAARDPDDTHVTARREHSLDGPGTAQCFVVRVG